MADYNSETPIRSQLPGQVLPDDVIIKIGDATNPTTQMASVDVHGSQYSLALLMQAVISLRVRPLLRAFGFRRLLRLMAPLLAALLRPIQI